MKTKACKVCASKDGEIERLSRQNDKLMEALIVLANGGAEKARAETAPPSEPARDFGSPFSDIGDPSDDIKKSVFNGPSRL